MPGFDPNSPPIRPGFYAIVKATAAAVVQAGSGSVVCIPCLPIWGPEGAATKVTSYADYQQKFGDTVDDNSFAVLGALAGDGTPQGGASAVYVYRIPLSGNAAATHTLSNTTPASALAVTAKYKGTFGNGLKLTVRAHPTDATKSQLLVLEGTQLLETWSYLTTSLAALATAVNNADTGSNYISVSVTVDGTALAAVSAVSMTGGTDGTAIGSDYSTAMTSVEGVPFNIVTFANLTDSTILASARTWLSNLNANVRNAMMVTGGGSSDTVSAAVTRSGLSSTSGTIVNAGVNNFLDSSDGVTTKSSAQMTGYFAGIIAGAGMRKSVTFARIPGYTLVARPSNDNVITALTGGVLLCTQDDEGVRIERQFTTFTDTTNPDMPYEVYSSILSNRIIQQVQTDVNGFSTSLWIGKVKNNSVTQKSYLGAVLDYLHQLERLDVLQKGKSGVVLDPNQDNSKSIWWPVLSFALEREVELILAVNVVS